MRDLKTVINDIDAYQPGEDWLDLEELLGELFKDFPLSEIPVEPLLGVFERFPTHDGYGVFWSILHGLEGIKGYELALLESLERNPSQFGVLMAWRILNSPGADAWKGRVILTLHKVVSNREAARQIVVDAERAIKDFAQ